MGDSELKRRTAKGLLWGGIGNGGMQLLSLLFGIVLSRLLSPTDYGIVGALAIFIALGGMLTESGFTLALVNKKDLGQADYSSVFWFNFCVSLACYAILFAGAPLVARFYNAPEMVALLRFQSLGFVFGGTATVPAAYLLRNLMVKERSRAQIGSMLVSGVAGLVCAWQGMGYWALAIQNVLYIAVWSATLWMQTPLRLSVQFDFGRIRGLLPFSLKQLAVTFFNNVNNNFFPVILGRYYGMWLTGCYTQGSKWTNMGSQTIRGMIDSVGQPVLREANDGGERLQRVFSRMLRFTVFVSFPCMLGLGLVAPELIVLTITDKWLEAVPIMQILCVWAAFVPVVQLYGNLFNSVNRPGVFMWNSILPGLLQLAVLPITFRFSINVMLVVYVCINVAWLGVWQAQARRICGISTRRVALSVAPYLLISCIVIGIAGVAASFFTSLALSLAVKIAVAVALYVLAMSRLESEMYRETVNYLFKRKGF